MKMDKATGAAFHEMKEQLVYMNKAIESSYFPELEEVFIYVNQNSYELITKHLGHEPSNLKIHPYLPDNQSIVIKEKVLEEFTKPKILPLSYFGSYK